MPRLTESAVAHISGPTCSAYGVRWYHTKAITTGAANAAQTEDAKVTISAYIWPKKAGITVYFEVLDPDDPVDNENPDYREDKTPYDPFRDDPYDAQVEGDLAPGDNRDVDKSMAEKPPDKRATLARYNAMQDALSARSATTRIQTIDGAERAVAEVELSITNRYAGDNYLVRATLANPQGKPFNGESWVVSYPGEDPQSDPGAEIPADKIASTCVLVAWNRVYVETDKMFRLGADLIADAGANQPDKKLIKTKTGFVDRNKIVAGDEVQILDTDNQTNFGEVGTVANVEIVTENGEHIAKIILTKELQDNYETAKHAHVGKLSDADDPDYKVFYEADTSAIEGIWNYAFVEVVFRDEGSGPVPYQHFMPLEPGTPAPEPHAFCDRWFHVTPSENRKYYFQIVGGPYHVHGSDHPFGENFVGLDSDDPYRHSCMVFIQRIESEAGLSEQEQAAYNRNVTAHEFRHFSDVPYTDPLCALYVLQKHCDDLNEPGIVPALPVPRPDPLPKCLMNYNRKRELTPRIGLFHIYYIRDWDPIWPYGE